MDHRQVAGRFNACFAAFRRFSDPALNALPRTLLVGGAAEPVYQPPAAGCPAVIRYTRDYAQSALHEIAHWCLAEPAARGQADYGLVYQPPPREPAAQARFYAAEVPVQALEMLLAAVAGVPFHFSADNPGMDMDPARPEFERQVRETCRALACRGPGEPGATMLAALRPDWRALALAEAGVAGCPGEAAR